VRARAAPAGARIRRRRVVADDGAELRQPGAAIEVQQRAGEKDERQAAEPA
jgi:hypothetical protein